MIFLSRRYTTPDYCAYQSVQANQASQPILHDGGLNHEALLDHLPSLPLYLSLTTPNKDQQPHVPAIGKETNTHETQTHHQTQHALGASHQHTHQHDRADQHENHHHAAPQDRQQRGEHIESGQ
tara:strand:- start:10568 stop:10939 length:372 start_codon:yes stop_codon:yes gene_type:complete